MPSIKSVCTLYLMIVLFGESDQTIGSAKIAAQPERIFTQEPSNNSKRFSQCIQRKGGVVSIVDLSSEMVGPLPPDAYLDLGITLKGTNGFDHVSNSKGPGQGGETPPRSTGEGPHSAGAYLGDSLGAGRLATLTVSFSKPVMAAGVSTIDLDSSTAQENAKVAIYSGPNGTGELIASGFAKNVNLQQNNLYFMGLASDKANIRSIVFTSYGKANDRVGIADIRYARPSKVSMWLWMGAIGVAMLLFAALLVRKRTVARRYPRSSRDPSTQPLRAGPRTYQPVYHVQVEHREQRLPPDP